MDYNKYSLDSKMLILQLLELIGQYQELAISSDNNELFKLTSDLLDFVIDACEV